MRGVENSLQALSEAGIRPVAISVDTPEVNREMMHEAAGYTFTFLSDPQLEAIRRYDLVHAGQGENGADVARPAEFLIDSSGTVRWRMMTENLYARARPEQVLEAAKALP
ncbi:MAG TPA: redoxin domain-containing protein [Pyrinomonadaceae bacterium]